MRTLLCLLLLGCTSSATHPDGASSGFKLTWDVDGTPYSGEPLAGATAMQGVLTLSGHDLDGYAIALSVEATTAGTYDLTMYPGTGFTWTDHTQSWSVSTTGGTGSVTITSFTATEVVGTFSANPVPALTGTTGMPAITNGVFDLGL